MSFGSLARLVCLALVLCACGTSVAAAQQWGNVVTPTPAPVVDDTEPPRTRHVLRERMLVPGVLFLVAGYAGSIAWSAYYFDSIHLGVLGCNDTYAGLHLLPIAGPVIGLVSAAVCLPDSVHFEEGLVPVVLSLAQIAGLILTIFGALGHDVPLVSVAIDSNGGYAATRWTF